MAALCHGEMSNRRGKSVRSGGASAVPPGPELQRRGATGNSQTLTVHRVVLELQGQQGDSLGKSWRGGFFSRTSTRGDAKKFRIWPGRGGEWRGRGTYFAPERDRCRIFSAGDPAAV